MFVLLMLVGCTHQPRTPVSTTPTTAPVDATLEFTAYNESVQATVSPPLGWRADPLKLSSDHAHQVWISPSGRTAFGVIRFSLPLPVGHEWALVGFMQNMKKSEGEGVLVSKQWDDTLPGIRFVADGGRYRVRTNLQVRGRSGWATYAGTLLAEPINDTELATAERAREATRMGK